KHIAAHAGPRSAAIELQPGPPPQRLDLEDHVAKLAVPARLLLVPASLRDWLADRLAIADRRWSRRHRDHEAVGESFCRHTQMHFALTPHDNFMVLGVVNDLEMGVFFGHVRVCRAKLDVVFALFGLHRNGQHRCIGFYLRKRRWLLLAGGQRVTGLRTVKLAERNCLADGGMPPFLELLAYQLEHAGDAPRSACG